MKKILLLALIVILMLTLSVSALAGVTTTLTYDLSCAGSVLNSGTNEIVVQTGDIITVVYKLSASESTSVSVTQNEIYYDHNFFELVAGSNTASAGYEDYVTSLQTRLDGKRYVYFNTLVTHTHTTTPAEIGTFRLKVIANSGESTVANVNNMATNYLAELYGATAVNLHVSIDNPLPQQFTVTYAAAGGTVSPTTVTVNAGSSVTLPKPTRQYYNFAYWTISGDSTQYNFGQTYTPTNDVTFTAVWTPVAAPAAPTGLGTVSASSVSATDGKITGTTTAMEYSASPSFNFAYTCSAGQTAGLAAGTYYVRFKAVGNTPPGSYTAVVVSANTPPPPPPEGGYDDCNKDSGCPMSSFTDLNVNAWYHDGVHFCLENGLMNGVGGNLFDPDGTGTRAMLVTILYRLEGSPSVTAGNPYNDVPSGTWFTNAVIWANAKGIVNGYGDGSFGPNDPITREQTATILYRYTSYKGYSVSGLADLSHFVDAGDVSSWALTEMRWANAKGLITGLPGSILAPQDYAVRAQIATILMRFSENIIN